MIRQAFHHRSGRIIASGRALLANFFLLSIWLDPSLPTRGTAEAYIFLAWYAVLSVAILLATWNDWWVERRLGGATHALDLLVFTFLVFVTDGFSNPYFAFSVFLVLSATMRWGWREATLTAILIALLFLVTALSTRGSSPEAGLQSFIIPGAHLVVLSIIIIWFGVNQPASTAHIVQLTGLNLGAEGERPPIRRMLEFAASQFPGARILLAWWEVEEPWTNVAALEAGDSTRFQFGPKEMPFIVDPDASDPDMVFDLPRRRLLVSRDGRKMLLSRDSPFNKTFAARFGIDRGMRIAVRADPFEAELFVLDDTGLSADDLDLGAHVGAELSSAFARTAVALATEEAAATRERLSFARDLHDSVVQFLAGVSMQLEGIRKSEKDDGIGPQIDALQNDLRLEQRDLRNFIAALRGGRGPAQLSDLSQYLQSLADRLARQWDIECELTTVPASIEASARLRQDVDLLVREALANAVRHGGAHKTTVLAEADKEHLKLTIADDGHGFAFRGELSDAELKTRKLGPWSLHERIHKRGGSLVVHSSDIGSRLIITLPVGETA